MKQESKLIKRILSDAFPYGKFSVKYKTANTYIGTSDKLIVTVSNADIDNVISIIKKNVCGIAVFKEGEIGMIHENYNQYNEPKIKLNAEWYDADLLEFIEVRYVRI